MLVDCANGAATAEAPELFRACRIQATFTYCAPDGKNINEGCGALHPETVAKTIAESNGAFDLGVTFDGDADRALFSDASGRVVNGDAVLLLAARDMQSRGVLPGSTIVATTMSNMGLEIALQKSGIRMLRANVGDKYVLEEMMKTGATLGGEQSGHIIFRDGEATTGDGLLTALRVMEVMARSGKSLADLIGDLKVFPQRIQNIRVREKVPLNDVPAVKAAIEAAQRELDGKGRVVVRYSGTETLARVMVEAESEEKMNALTDGIAGANQVRPRRVKTRQSAPNSSCRDRRPEPVPERSSGGFRALQSKSRQFFPTPISTISGTESICALSICSRTSVRIPSISASGTSNTSSSCTCSVIRDFSPRSRIAASIRIMAILIRSAAVPLQRRIHRGPLRKSSQIKILAVDVGNRPHPSRTDSLPAHRGGFLPACDQ